MECQYCKNLFATKTNLNNHQQTAKYCLKIQGKENKEKYKCLGCSKSFIKIYEYNRHINNCDANDNINIFKTSNVELQSKINSLEDKIDFLNTEINKKDNHIKELENKLENLAKTAINRPTTTNTTNSNTNNILNLAPLDMDALTEKFKIVINEKMTEEHLLEGQEGIAKLIASCFTNEDGRKLITCSDTSRGVWKSLDKDGNIIKDMKANKIAKKIEPIAISKADILIDMDEKKRKKVYEIKDIQKRKQERREAYERDESFMKGLKKDSSHYRMYEERLKKQSLIMEEEEENEQKLLEEFRQANELYLLDFEDDEKPFKLFSGKKDIKNLNEDSTRFSNSLISLV
jgi:hypothetical protein